MNELIHINYAFLQVDATKKSINISMDKEYEMVQVEISINGNNTVWNDNQYVNAEIRAKLYNGDLKDCLRYLQGFQIKTRTDLNEIYYNETTKYEVA